MTYHSILDYERNKAGIDWSHFSWLDSTRLACRINKTKAEGTSDAAAER